eukprot:241115_1
MTKRKDIHVNVSMKRHEQPSYARVVARAPKSPPMPIEVLPTNHLSPTSRDGPRMSPCEMPEYSHSLSSLNSSPTHKDRVNRCLSMPSRPLIDIAVGVHNQMDVSAIIRDSVLRLLDIASQLHAPNPDLMDASESIEQVTSALSPISKSEWVPRPHAAPRRSDLEEEDFQQRFQQQRQRTNSAKEMDATTWVMETFLHRQRSSAGSGSFLSDSTLSAESTAPTRRMRRAVSEMPRTAIKLSGPSESLVRRSGSLITEALVMVSKLLKDPIVRSSLQSFGTWSFDVFKLSQATQHPLLVAMEYFLSTEMDPDMAGRLQKDKLLSFILMIENKYLDIPYHNRLHATDVLSCLVYWLRSDSFMDYVPDGLYHMAGVVAACVHDVAHPGLTNAFEVATGSELAMLYNDQSVLENMHCSTALRLMKRDAFDFLANFVEEERRVFRETVVELVLGTDFARHREHLKLCQDVLDRVESGSVKPDAAAQDVNPTVVLSMALHVSDVSNPTRPLSLAKEWVKRLTEEMYRQGDKERELGLAVTPTMDRSTSEIEEQQLAFCEWVMLPMYEKWAKLIPESDSCLDQLQKNTDYWRLEVKKKQERRLSDPNIKPGDSLGVIPTQPRQSNAQNSDDSKDEPPPVLSVRF